MLIFMSVVCKYGSGYKCFYFSCGFCVLWRFASSHNRVKAITIICCIRNGTNSSICFNNRIFSFNCISVSFFPCWFRVASISVDYAVIKGIFGIRLIKKMKYFIIYFRRFFFRCIVRLRRKNLWVRKMWNYIYLLFDRVLRI